MDEIAADLRVDPVQFRLRYLGANKRGADALIAVTKQARWQERPSPAPTSAGSKAIGRGVAISNRADTICGAVAEVEVDKATGHVTVKRFTLSHDCGLIINPDGLKNQIEGNIIQGVSRTLMEEVKFDGIGNHDFGLEHLPGHQISRGSGNRYRIDQSSGDAGPRRRRTVERPDSSGHRQRDLRCHRCAPARGSVHAGAGADRIEESVNQCAYCQLFSHSSKKSSAGTAGESQLLRKFANHAMLINGLMGWAS